MTHKFLLTAETTPGFSALGARRRSVGSRGHWRGPSTLARLAAPVAISLAAACAVPLDAEDTDVQSASAKTGCLASKNISWTYRSGDSLPLGQSRPGANVTLFLDFDGGEYSEVKSGKVSSNYDSDKRKAIERSVEQIAGNYSRWSINVTTDKKVFDSARKRARIFVAKSEGDSGEASTDAISGSSRHTGWVGVDAVLRPGSAEKCAYVPTHEFAHNFTLRGTEVDYADLHPNAKTGAFMGGRDSQFSGYDWIALESKVGWQNPAKIIGRIAGTSGGDDDGGGDDGGGDDDNSCNGKCSSSCKCARGEGRCRKDSHCQSGLFCKIRSGKGTCRKR